MGTDALPLWSRSARTAPPGWRQADTGLAQHRSLRVGDLAADLATDPTAAASPAAVRPVWDLAANQRKVDAVRQVEPLTDALDDLEDRIADLLAKTKRLELD